MIRTADNTATNTVVDTVDVGAFPIGVAVTPDGAFAYVATLSFICDDVFSCFPMSSIDGSVSVIDTATNTVAATVPVGFAPIGVAITCGQSPLFWTTFLQATVIDLGLKQGIENRLLKKLNAALEEFDDDIDDVDDVDDVVERLDDFIAIVEAKRGKQIPEADADELIAAAEEIIVLLQPACARPAS